MTLSEIYDLSDDFNSNTQAAYYTNTTSADMKMYLTNLSSAWTTDHGQEICANMSKLFSTLEDAMNEMEIAMAAAKNCYVTISTHTETSSYSKPNEGGESSE